jgi:O-antigen/teichoic acid export membrane protein
MSSTNRATPDTGDSIGRNAAFAFAGQMVTSLATGALTLYLVRALGPKDFGVLAIAIGLGTIVLLPGDFGISNSTARFVAEERGNWPIVGALVRHAIRLKLAASALLSVALFLLAEPIASGYGSPGLAPVLRAMAAVVFFQSFMMMFAALFVALGRVSLNLRIISTEALIEAGAAATLVILGGGATGAALGRAVGYAVAALLGFVLARRVIGSEALRRGEAPPGTSKRIFGYAGALVVIDGAYALLAPVGTLLLGALLNASAVGVFAAPIRFITFLHYPGLSIAAGIAPRLARSAKAEPDVGALVSGLRWIMLIQTVLVAPTIVWAGPIADILLGDGYGRSGDVLAVLAPFTFLSGFAPLVSLSVNYLGEARRRVPIAVGTLVLTAVLDLILIPWVGLLGAAIATDIAYGFYVLGHFWLCKRLVDMPLRPVARDLLRCLVAAGAMTAVMAAFGTSDLGPVAIILGGAAGVITYVAALLITRAVTVDELRAARGAVARKLGRGRPAAAA